VAADHHSRTGGQKKREEVIFIDDNADNTREGLEPGMKDYTFQGQSRTMAPKWTRSGYPAGGQLKIQDLVA
jgi:hypothetical protein